MKSHIRCALLASVPLAATMLGRHPCRCDPVWQQRILRRPAVYVRESDVAKAIAFVGGRNVQLLHPEYADWWSGASCALRFDSRAYKRVDAKRGRALVIAVVKPMYWPVYLGET